MKNQIKFIQIQKDNESHFETTSKQWIPFIREVNTLDGTYRLKEQILGKLVRVWKITSPHSYCCCVLAYSS